MCNLSCPCDAVAYSPLRCSTRAAAAANTSRESTDSNSSTATTRVRRLAGAGVSPDSTALVVVMLSLPRVTTTLRAGAGKPPSSSPYAPNDVSMWFSRGCLPPTQCMSLWQGLQGDDRWFGVAPSALSCSEFERLTISSVRGSSTSVFWAWHPAANSSRRHSELMVSWILGWDLGNL